MKLSIIMPAYNERKTLREIVGRVLAVDLGSVGKELIIVDDGSTDGTRDILREMDGRDGIGAVFQPGNLGKGAAVWTGLRASTGDVVVIPPDSFGRSSKARRTSSTAPASSDTREDTGSSTSGMRWGTAC